MIENDEHGADHHVFRHGGDGALDELGVVLEERQMDARHLAVDALDLCAHVLRNLDGIGARLLGDLQTHAGLAVDPEHGPDVFGRVGDIGDVLQVNRDARLRQHHQVLDLLQVFELPLAPHQERAIAAVDLADRNVLVFRPQHVDDAVDRQIQRSGLFPRQLDVDLPAKAAVDRHRRHAVDALEARRQRLLGQFAQLHAIERAVDAFDGQAQNRLRVRVELLNHRRVRILGQAAAHPVDARADVVHRLVEVVAPFEVHLDLAVALGRGRVHLATPDTALSCCSSGRVTSSSISSGPTPV